MISRRTGLRALAGLLGLGLVLGGGWLWLRDASFVRVADVTVRGASSSEEGRIRAALEDAARRMTTLHVREDALRRAVAGFPSVADLRVSTDLPDGMTIDVVEHEPAAALLAGERRVPATSGGLVLTGVDAGEELPAIEVDSVPAARVTDRRTASALLVAGAAPEPLRERAERLFWGARGLTVDLREGPPLIFGGRDHARAKWVAAARVLAEPSAAGATYLDLRVPGRVAAGGLGPLTAEEGTDPAAEAAEPALETTQPDPSTLG